MRLARRELADHRNLAVIVMMALEPADQLAAAVGDRDQPRGELQSRAGLCHVDRGVRRRRADGGDPCAVNYSVLGATERGVERGLQGSIADDVAQRRQPLFQCIEAHAPEATALRNIDGGYRRDRVARGRDRAPDPEALENQPCAVR